MSQTPTILLTGGGSGGHITPLLSLARELKQQSPDCTIIYVGHKGDPIDTFKKRSSDFDFMAFIKAGKFRRYHGNSFIYHFIKLKTLILNIRDLFRLPVSVVTAYRLMKRFKPDVVFSKGGFVAVPVCFAARLRGVPIITHDSDTVPGLANRLTARWAQLHATGMPARFYDYPPKTTVYVGIPLDSRIVKVTPRLQKQAKAALKIPENSQVLLLSGGGNGSQRLNDLLIKIAPQLLKNNLSLHLIHLSGAAHEPAVKQAYRQLLTKEQLRRVLISGFSPDFYQLSAAADLVITRAGATTIAELGAAGKACIVIAHPYLAGGHQLKNAEELAKNDAAVVMDDQVTPAEIQAVINELLGDDARRFELAKKLYAGVRSDAAARLAELIIRTAAGESQFV